MNTGHIDTLKHVPRSCNLDLSNAPKNTKNGPVWKIELSTQQVTCTHAGTWPVDMDHLWEFIHMILGIDFDLKIPAGQVQVDPQVNSWHALKHINIQHHYIWELLQSGTITIEQVSSSDNLANLFMKPLPRNHHHWLLTALNITWLRPSPFMGEYWNDRRRPPTTASYFTTFVDMPTTIYLQHYILIPEVSRFLSFSIFIFYFDLWDFSYTYFTYIFLSLRTSLSVIYMHLTESEYLYTYLLLIYLVTVITYLQ